MKNPIRKSFQLEIPIFDDPLSQDALKSERFQRRRSAIKEVNLYFGVIEKLMS